MRQRSSGSCCCTWCCSHSVPNRVSRPSFTSQLKANLIMKSRKRNFFSVATLQKLDLRGVVMNLYPPISQLFSLRTGDLLEHGLLAPRFLLGTPLLVMKTETSLKELALLCDCPWGSLGIGPRPSSFLNLCVAYACIE